MNNFIIILCLFIVFIFIKSLETISKANHLFEGKLDPLMGTMTKYINKHKL